MATQYVTQQDLEDAITAKTVLGCYNDGNTGTVNARALNANAARASRLVDGSVARAYKAPWPTSEDQITGDFAGLIKEATLLFLIPMSFLRHPELVKTFGEVGRVRLYGEAQTLCEQIANGTKVLPEAGPARGNMRQGGIVTNDANPMVSGVGGDWGT